MSARRLAAHALLLLIAAALVACGTARRSEPVAGPLPIEDERALRGQTAFMRSCHHCHPTGEAGLGPALNNKPLAGWMIRAQVRMGIGSMPSFPQEHLSSDELDDIVRYLHALRRGR